MSINSGLHSTESPPSPGQGPEAIVAIDGYDLLGYQAAAGAATPDVYAAVRKLLQGFGPVDVGPGLHLPRYELIPTSSAWQLWVNSRLAQEDADLTASLGALEWHLINAALSYREDLLQLHGAALCVPTRREGIVLSGDSGSGKTTLTLGLMLRGFVPFSDDVTVVDRDTLEVRAVQRAFHVADDTLRLVEALTPGSLNWDDGLRGYFSPPQFAERPVPIRWVVFIQHRPAQSPELVRLSPAEAATAILGQAVNLSRAPRETLSATARLIESAGVFRLQTGDLQESIAVIQRLVAGSIDHGV